MAIKGKGKDILEMLSHQEYRSFWWFFAFCRIIKAERIKFEG